ncbi:MAG: hypothetical protein R6X10_17520 [Desulfobacterales bacterium]
MKIQNICLQQSVFFPIKIVLFLILTLTLVFSSAYSAEVTLRWDPNTEPDLAGYKLYYDTNSGAPYDGADADQGASPVVIAIENLANADQPEYTITGLAGSREYFFAVTAYDNETPSLESDYSAEVTITTYTIGSSAGQNGTISPSGSVALSHGADQTFTFTPNAGYHVENVLVDGSSFGLVSSYTFTNITSDHTISANFAVNTYTITASAGSGGAISPSGSVSADYGSSKTFTFTPGSGYHIATVLVDGASVGAVSSYTFSSITANHTISVSFAVNTYTITASAGPNGAISPSGSVSADYGSSKTFAFTPSSGYRIENVLVDGASVGAVSSYTFSSIASDHTIAASFAVNTYTITASAGPNGAISPSGSVSADYGTSKTFTFTPGSGYRIENVLVDGASVGAVSSYTFADITGNHTILVNFQADNQPPVANAGPDQLVEERSVVTLSGLNSSDPDDGIARFSWIQIQGTPVVLSHPDAEETTFIAPDVSSEGETLVFQVTVEDYSGAQATDTCIVNVSWVNIPPVADAGSDQTAYEGDLVVLDASGSSDPDDEIASFQWTQIEGVPVSLSDAQAMQPAFIAPDTGPEGASLKFSLIVTDQRGLQSSDTCIVNVIWVNMPPTADAGPDQTGYEGETIVLHGENSTDPDDGILSYQWAQLNGTPVAFLDPESPQTEFIAPEVLTDIDFLTFELTVTDHGGLKSTATCTVGVKPVEENDSTPPELMIEIPTSDTYFETTDQNITLSGYASDDIAVSAVTWNSSRGDNGMASGTENWKISMMRIKPKLNVITITAIDAAGNSASTTINIYRPVN